LEASVDVGLAGRASTRRWRRCSADYSRSRLQAWTREGRVSVNGEVRRPRDRVAEGDRLALRALSEDAASNASRRTIPLDIVYEDEHLLVIDKPAGLVVHPAAGNPDRDLAECAASPRPGLAALPRAGSSTASTRIRPGCWWSAATQAAHKRLVEAMAAREILARVPRAGGRRHAGRRH
jgi:23S rRNA pseudouridine1911/1915/1917 synthase